MDDQEKSEFEKMKTEIEQIRLDYRSAKKILQDVTAFVGNFEALKSILNNENNGVIANHNIVKTQKDQIVEYVRQAQTQLNEITVDLQKVKNNIESMQTSYNEFSVIKGKVTGINGEIDTLLSNSKGLHNDITATKKEALNTLESIKNTYQSIAGNIKDIQNVYQEFLQIRSKIDDKKTGLQAILNDVQILNSQSNTLFAEIKAFRDDSKSFLSEIEQNKKQTDVLKSDVQKNFDYTQLKKDEIEKATGLIIDTSFSSVFKNRQEKIEDGLSSWYSWKNIFFAGLILLAFLVVFLPSWIDLTGLAWYSMFLTRIFYTSPLLFLIAFSAVQYTKERDLAEKYAFKAASSAAIRSHIDYLIEKFKDDDDECKVLDFAKETFSTIYKEPYAVHDGLEKRIKELEKKEKTDDSKNHVNIEDLVTKAKELKDIIPTDSTIEKILAYFAKNKN